MKNKLLSAVLALTLVLGLSVPTHAAGIPTQDEAAQVLSALDIMSGNESGDLMLGNSVSRAEFTKMAVSASTFRDSVGPETATDPYPDVSRTHWAAGYIQAAVDHALVRGDLYGRFNPNSTITLAEGATIAERLLGYQDADFAGAYPSGQMALYKTLELSDGVATISPGAPMTRGDALYLFYNLLTANTKDGKAYLSVLKPGQTLLTASGDIDMVALINSAMNGPMVAEGSWQSKIPFTLSTAKVYRSGAASSVSAIVQSDVVYWSKPMRTLWVYSNRVSGSIQSVTPTSAPTSVTVAGKSYGIETSAAAYALSDLGTYKAGDTVTLLLGRDSKVVSVLSSSSASASGDICGLVTSVAPGTYTDAGGNDYTASTITITATDGNTYSYRWDKSGFKAGNLVRVTTSGGSTQIKSVSSISLSGKVSGDGAKVAGYTFSGDVEILDTYESSAVRVYPSRLAGVTLNDGAVRYYQLNTKGEISKLVLNDVTGDLYQYGVITSVNEYSEGMTLVGSYAYDIGGAAKSIPQSNTLYGVSVGPFVLKTDSKGSISMKNLTTIKLTGVDGHTAQASNRSYTISDNVAVYEVRNGDYFYSSLSVVSGGNYTLTGWYDKDEISGGRIRVITAIAG
ncbi:MAG: S-layer homology domain-containing protein [Clostridia bacterium]|nr:S-layer homology domain-containing protein [Clostridia bacterium]